MKQTLLVLSLVLFSLQLFGQRSPIDRIVSRVYRDIDTTRSLVCCDSLMDNTSVSYTFSLSDGFVDRSDSTPDIYKFIDDTITDEIADVISKKIEKKIYNRVTLYGLLGDRMKLYKRSCYSSTIYYSVADVVEGDKYLVSCVVKIKIYFQK